MVKAQVELDFLGLDSSSSSPDAPPPTLSRRRSFAGISKINPEIVKSVIASSAVKPESDAAATLFYSPPTPPRPSPPPPPPPTNSLLFQPLSFMGASTLDTVPEIAPLTIFYKGTISVFDLPKEKAEDVIKFVTEKGDTKSEDKNDGPSLNAQNVNFLGALDGDLPIKRKKSLQRFFEKRKERLISVGPYPTEKVAQLYHH